ncbi:sulfite exporter TauE/SafE family protein [Sinimarinibacterium sp. CAU 1509]|uniref:sulfite exporter TauE/SafE family protein n=1 Tax=Sinimarinibacterium sp. CAU 1509 TaxID=2562283 RepID=UPI0010AD4C82|nr:sulfite exporter TauE/SafE family protein [Sinimarinibacterium sp. CAU 1509]TJY59939.1 sulfite exporter TauE/SafE family protein [Sinimarinibacterium sp. CAU 1509]
MTLIDVAIVGVGFASATLSGVAGLGGGTILIGVFYAVGMAPAEAVPLFAAVQFVSNSSRTLAYVRHVEWHAAGWFLLAALPATFMVAPFVANIDVAWVRLILAGLILASLVPTHAVRKPLGARPAFVMAGLLNGSVGMFVGATGLIVGRLFFRPEWRKETTIGTLALTQMLGHGLRVIAYGWVGFNAFARPLLLLLLCAAVIGGTALGKRLNGRVSEQQFARLFRVILVVLSLKLAYDGFIGLWEQ